MNNKKQLASTLLSLGMIILLITAIMPLVGVMHSCLKYIYSAGAALTLISRFLDKYNGKNIGIRRLYRIQLVSAFCYCISAALLFYSSSEQDWLSFLMSGAVLQIYTLFRIQSEEKKEAKKNNKQQ